VKDKSEYLKLRKEIGKMYRHHMGNHYPAMSLLVVKDLLEDGALIEIEATAVIP
jgi:enamine deaminase RidA (YjgF/YER057c/UK114 family)